ncbi:hypothetical protein VR41_05485 [Streptomyces sp. NRRL B-1568]|nr:hypothetical protein VR41_05485 [Streptomyces sp. NRRL B-1568]
MPPSVPAVPRLGSYAVDTRTGRLGQVMDHHAGYVQLRPPRGGLEWNCPPEHARPAAEAQAAEEAETEATSGWRP